jgi:hypothetical protein
VADVRRLQQRVLKLLARFEARGAETAEELAAGAAAATKLARASRAAQATARAARAETATTAALRTLGAMFPDWRPAAETLLRQAEINVPRPVLRNVALELSRVLGGRTIASLAAADLAALEDLARARMLVLSTAVDEQLLQAAARRAVRALGQKRPGNTALVTVPARDGLWVYVLPATRGDVVLGEAFAPARAGVAVPRDPPPLPGVARPLWALDDGTLAVARPALPDLRLSTGLPPNALQEAPSTLIAVLRRAEARRAGASAGTITGAPIQYVNVPLELRGALGGAVRAVAYRVTEGGLRRVTIIGRTRAKAARLRDLKVLPSVESLFGEGTDIQRLHLWGRVLGDSVTAGIAYGPQELNDAMGRLENIIKVHGGARMDVTELTVSAVIEMRAVGGTDQPFLRRATYQWTDAGTPYTFSVGLDDATGAVYLRSGLGEGEDVWSRVKVRVPSRRRR